jgi:hypothetical protein
MTLGGGKDFLIMAWNTEPSPAAAPTHWEICYKAGKLNPRPTCWTGSKKETIENPNGLSGGQLKFTGLKSDKWYTFKVRAKYTHAWKSIGHLQVKTLK